MLEGLTLLEGLELAGPALQFLLTPLITRRDPGTLKLKLREMNDLLKLIILWLYSLSKFLHKKVFIFFSLVVVIKQCC